MLEHWSSWGPGLSVHILHHILVTQEGSRQLITDIQNILEKKIVVAMFMYLSFGNEAQKKSPHIKGLIISVKVNHFYIYIYIDA